MCSGYFIFFCFDYFFFLMVKGGVEPPLLSQPPRKTLVLHLFGWVILFSFRTSRPTQGRAGHESREYQEQQEADPPRQATLPPCEETHAGAELAEKR